MHDTFTRTGNTILLLDIVAIDSFHITDETEVGTACKYITLNFGRQNGSSLQISIKKMF